MVRESEQFERYRLVEMLGRGSYADVWKAWDPEHERHVALKIFRPSVVDQTQPERIRQEVVATAGLSHGNIVRLLDSGLAATNPYIVYELIDGVTLDEWMAFVEPSFSEVAAMLGTVAEALAYLHGEGVVHRDLKPKNILVNYSGEPYLADLGLAQVADKRMTIGGGGIGTVAYMAPEQLAGSEVTGTADVFALGVMLFEILTGTLPFAAASPVEYCAQLSAKPVPPVRDINNVVPTDLAAVCDCCLQRIPSDRYATAQDLVDDLSRFRRGQPVHARRHRFARQLARTAKRLVLPLLLLVVLTVIGSWVWGEYSARGIELTTARIVAASSVEAVDEQLLGIWNRAGVARGLRDLLGAQPPDEQIKLLYCISQLDSLTDVEVLELADLVGDAHEVGELYLRAASSVPEDVVLAAIRASARNPGEALVTAATLFLGDEAAAVEAAHVDEDPTDRDALMNELARWKVAEPRWTALFEHESDSLRSVAMIAAGEAASGLADQRKRVTHSLRGHFERNAAGLIQSSARYALTAMGAERSSVGRGISPDRAGTESELKSLGIELITVEPSQGNSFRVSSTEITKALYRKVVGDKLPPLRQTRRPDVNDDQNEPVHSVRVIDAVIFCNELSKRIGRTPYYRDDDGVDVDEDANGFRLPTRDQWFVFHAARATTVYPFGSREESALHYGWFVEERKGYFGLHPVGRKRPNGLGVFDACGNVVELVQAGGTFYYAGTSTQHQSMDCKIQKRPQELHNPELAIAESGFRIVCPFGGDD